MTTVELRNEIHMLVDEIGEEEKLQLLKAVVLTLHPQPANIMDTLTEEERKELLEAYEESFDKSKWIPHEEVMKKYKTWLTK